MAYCWSKHYSQKRRDFPTLYIRGHVCQMAGKAALGIFPLHRLLQRHSPAALSLQSALGRNARVNTCTQFYNCKRSKKCCWQVVLKKGSRGL